MSNILLAGNNNAGFSALNKEALRLGLKIATAPIIENNSNIVEKETGSIKWTARSAMSAHSGLTAAINMLDVIDTAIICIANLAISREINFTTIDITIDKFVKGPIFLSRNLIRYFNEKKEGNLVLIFQQAELGPLDNTINAAWGAYCRELLAQAASVEFSIFGIIIQPDNTNDFSDFSKFVFKTIANCKQKDSGKLFKYKRNKLFKLQ